MTTKSQFIALLNGQLEGAASLREIEGGLESHKSRLYHLGATPPRRATPADANARCPDAVFSELFAVMAARTHRPLRRAVAGTTYLIDASGLRLDGRSLKVGALLDQGLRRQIAMSSTTPMPTGRSTPRSTGAGQRHYRCTANADRARRHYVFDLGYYDDAPSCWCAWRKPGRKPPPVRLRFARLVRVNLMRRKPLDALLDPEPALIGNLAQRALQWHLS